MATARAHGDRGQHDVRDATTSFVRCSPGPGRGTSDTWAVSRNDERMLPPRRTATAPRTPTLAPRTRSSSSRDHRQEDAEEEHGDLDHRIGG